MMNQILDAKEINEEKIVEQLRCLGIDMIHEANSGHPGIVLGAAPILYTLYANHLQIDSFSNIQTPFLLQFSRNVLCH